MEPMDVEPLDSSAGVEKPTSRHGHRHMELALRQLADVAKSYSLTDGFVQKVLDAARLELLEELLGKSDGGFPGLDVAAVRKQVTTFLLLHSTLATYISATRLLHALLRVGIDCCE